MKPNTDNGKIAFGNGLLKCLSSEECNQYLSFLFPE